MKRELNIGRAFAKEISSTSLSSISTYDTKSLVLFPLILISCFDLERSSCTCVLFVKSMFSSERYLKFASLDIKSLNYIRLLKVFTSSKLFFLISNDIIFSHFNKEEGNSVKLL